MLLAQRFGMYYIDENGNKALPYIIHRTSLGCYERTLAYLIEEYAGALPTWMMPEQVRFLPITDRAADYCAQQADQLRAAGLPVEVDGRNEKIGKKIREATLEKIPFMLVVGDRDMEAGTVSVRTRTGEDLGAMTLADFSAKLAKSWTQRPSSNAKHIAPTGPPFSKRGPSYCQKGGGALLTKRVFAPTRAFHA